MLKKLLCLATLAAIMLNITCCKGSLTERTVSQEGSSAATEAVAFGDGSDGTSDVGGTVGASDSPIIETTTTQTTTNATTVKTENSASEELTFLSGKYYLEGQPSGEDFYYEFYGNNVNTYYNDELEIDNRHYRIIGNELIIGSDENVDLYEPKICILSEDMNSFIYKHWDGTIYSYKKVIG